MSLSGCCLAAAAFSLSVERRSDIRSSVKPTYLSVASTSSSFTEACMSLATEEGDFPELTPSISPY